MNAFRFARVEPLVSGLTGLFSHFKIRSIFYNLFLLSLHVLEQLQSKLIFILLTNDGWHYILASFYPIVVSLASYCSMN